MDSKASLDTIALDMGFYWFYKMDADLDGVVDEIEVDASHLSRKSLNTFARGALFIARQPAMSPPAASFSLSDLADVLLGVYNALSGRPTSMFDNAAAAHAIVDFFDLNDDGALDLPESIFMGLTEGIFRKISVRGLLTADRLTSVMIDTVQNSCSGVKLITDRSASMVVKPPLGDWARSCEFVILPGWFHGPQKAAVFDPRRVGPGDWDWADRTCNCMFCSNYPNGACCQACFPSNGTNTSGARNSTSDQTSSDGRRRSLFEESDANDDLEKSSAPENHPLPGKRSVEYPVVRKMMEDLAHLRDARAEADDGPFASKMPTASAAQGGKAASASTGAGERDKAGQHSGRRLLQEHHPHPHPQLPMGGVQWDMSKGREFYGVVLKTVFGEGACVGVLISEYWVLGSSHCGRPTHVPVAVEFMSDGETFGVSQVVTSPMKTAAPDAMGYDGYFSDVVLIRLTRPATGRATIKLHEGEAIDLSKCKEPAYVEHYLLASRTPVDPVTPENCAAAYSGVNRINIAEGANSMCVEPKLKTGDECGRLLAYTESLMSGDSTSRETFTPAENYTEGALSDDIYLSNWHMNEAALLLPSSDGTFMFAGYRSVAEMGLFASSTMGMPMEAACRPSLFIRTSSYAQWIHSVTEAAVFPPVLLSATISDNYLLPYDSIFVNSGPSAQLPTAGYVQGAGSTCDQTNTTISDAHGYGSLYMRLQTGYAPFSFSSSFSSSSSSSFSSSSSSFSQGIDEKHEEGIVEKREVTIKIDTDRCSQVPERMPGSQWHICPMLKGCELDWSDGTCHSPECTMSVDWKALSRDLKPAGKAFSGGLGTDMDMSSGSMFRSWVCASDWGNATEQAACGVGPGELACFRYDEGAPPERAFVAYGLNEEKHLVTPAKQEDALRRADKGKVKF